MLKSCLLGQFSISLDDQPVELAARPTQLLLIYLLLQPGIPHRREKLAGLLWPDSTRRNALSNLRGALWRARKALQFSGNHGWEHLQSDDRMIRLHLRPGDWLDTAVLDAQIAGDFPTDELIEIASVCNGELLPGYYEDWIIAERQRLQTVFECKMGMLLECLLHERRWREALEWAERWIAQGNVPEPAFRALILAHAGMGDLAGATAQYQRCAEVLRNELDVEPSLQTRLALEQARFGDQQITKARLLVESATTQPEPRLPDFLKENVHGVINQPAVFVGREDALAGLDRYLEQSLNGHGQAAFVSGEAGSGKTALLQAFVRRASAEHPDLVAAFGACQAFFGQGDPYLPFRKALAMLTGDVEQAWASGLISKAQAQRNWSLLPESLEALLEAGPDLFESFLPGLAFLDRAEAVLLSGDPRLQALKKRLSNSLGETAAIQAQAGFFEQYLQVLRRLSARHPLVIVIDDLQWVDRGSAQLLFHLARCLSGARVLILGAFRPEEISAGRDGERHPLEPLFSELKRFSGKIILDLDLIGERSGREFVAALLDSEPNRLEEDFRNELYRRTRGQPLFTIQLLRDLQERGEIRRDEGAHWTASKELNWEDFPPKVEGVIGARLGRLDPQMQEMLSVAAVEGEEFTVQVLEGLQESSGREILHQLSHELEARHRLVRELGDVQVGRQRLQRFRFSHALIQEYLYQQLGTAERRVLHAEVANILERLYAEDPGLVCTLLARHYTEAGEKSKAVTYLLQAGDQARGKYAHHDAIDHYRQALSIQKESGDIDGAARTLLKLNLVYHSDFDFPRAQQALEEGLSLWQHTGQSGPRHSFTAPVKPYREPLFEPDMELPTFDPGLAFRDLDMRIVYALFCGLVESTPDYNIVPVAAKSWEVRDDGRRYFFHLKRDLTWSDGRPVTATDFEFAWKRILEPGLQSPMATLFYDLRGARAFHQGQIRDPEQVGVFAPDPFTLQVELVEPAAYFPHLLAHNSFFAVPKHRIERYGQAWIEPDKIVTNGPYQIETWEPGKVLKFSRNPRYPGRYDGNVDQVELIYYPDNEAGYQAFLAGELDNFHTWRSVIPQDELDRHQENGQLSIQTELAVASIHFVTDCAPFDDRRVRRAFVQAVDRQRLADEAYSGLFLPASGGYLPPGIPGHSPGIGLPYDPEAARALLAEAGFPGGRGFPKVNLSVGGTWRKVLPFVREMWLQNLGIEIADPRHVFEYLKDWKGKFHFQVAGWKADYPDPDSFLRANIYLDITRWRNAQFESLIRSGRRMLDQNKRLEFYRRADRILIEEAALVPLLYNREMFLHSKRVLRLGYSGINGALWKNILLDPEECKR